MRREARVPFAPPHPTPHSTNITRHRPTAVRSHRARMNAADAGNTIASLGRGRHPTHNAHTRTGVAQPSWVSWSVAACWRDRRQSVLSKWRGSPRCGMRRRSEAPSTANHKLIMPPAAVRDRVGKAREATLTLLQDSSSGVSGSLVSGSARAPCPDTESRRKRGLLIGVTAPESYGREHAELAQTARERARFDESSPEATEGFPAFGFSRDRATGEGATRVRLPRAHRRSPA